jgi:hypothetical protein
MLNVWKYGHLCENLTFIRYLCEICSMCENMAICVEIWLSLDICVKYAQCVKIRSFVSKFVFHWIFVWNMFNVWKYGRLCGNLTFIWYLCEICWMCENMAISDEHYTESGNCSIADEEKGRRALTTCVSYLGKGRCANKTCVSHLSKGRCVV